MFNNGVYSGNCKSNNLNYIFTAYECKEAVLSKGSTYDGQACEMYGPAFCYLSSGSWKFNDCASSSVNELSSEFQGIMCK